MLLLFKRCKPIRQFIVKVEQPMNIGLTVNCRETFDGDCLDVIVPWWCWRLRWFWKVRRFVRFFGSSLKCFAIGFPAPFLDFESVLKTSVIA